MQHTLARKVIHRGPTKVVGKFPSVMNGRMCHWESQLERDRMHQLELDPAVLSFKEQPKTYALTVAGRRVTYTPDLEVMTKIGVYIEEVKPAKYVHKFAALFSEASSRFSEDGKHFSVVTDTEIRQEPRLRNIKYLLPFRNFIIGRHLTELIEEAFWDLRIFTLGELKGLMASNGEPRWAPWALLAHNTVGFDITQPLNDSTRLWLIKGD